MLEIKSQHLTWGGPICLVLENDKNPEIIVIHYPNILTIKLILKVSVDQDFEISLVNYLKIIQ